jgi:hypothetical protein
VSFEDELAWTSSGLKRKMGVRCLVKVENSDLARPMAGKGQGCSGRIRNPLRDQRRDPPGSETFDLQ